MILITGAAGYIGSVAMLLANRYVDPVVLPGQSQAIGVDSFIKGAPRPDILIHKIDINDVESMTRIMRVRDIHAIINFAGIVGDPACIKYPVQAVNSNLEGVKALVEAAKRSGTVKKIVQASTCSVYGYSEEELIDENSQTKPLGIYAETKLLAEGVVKASGIEYAILRFSTAFGWSPSPRFDLTVNEFVRDAFHQRLIEVYRKDDWRPYAHVADLAQVCITAVNNSAVMGTYNVGWERNNHTKQMIIDTISKYINIRTMYVDGQGMDRRNYKVNFDHLARTLTWRRFQTIDDGILEIIDQVAEGGIDADSQAYRSDYLNC